jgi:predicted membrane channel-forming protein YqfA (hemolysin III family)
MIELKDHKELPDGWCKYDNTLSGYRVNLSWKQSLLSIFDRRHNEFWMIWSEIAPLIVLTQVSIWYLSSEKFFGLPEFYKVLTVGVHFAIFITRICSSSYHIFNCVSLRLNQTLINIDLIGICQGALGSPWFIATLAGTKTYTEDVFLVYTSLLFSNYVMCIIVFGYLLAYPNKNELLSHISITLLLILASIGNGPLIIIGFSSSFSTSLRALCLCGSSSLFIGYMIFVSHIPERFFTAGAADGKIWNSHVIWHNFVTISQICFMSSTMV